MIKIFDETYDSESLSDLFRDIHECMDKRYNPIIEEVEKLFPRDENGFNNADYQVIIKVKKKEINS